LYRLSAFKCRPKHVAPLNKKRRKFFTCLECVKGVEWETEGGFLKVNTEEEKRIREKIRQITTGGTYLKIHEQEKKKRLAWWQENNGNLRLSGSLPKQAFQMVLFEYMKIDPKDIKVIYEDEKKITWHSFNFCPILEACNRLHLITLVVCKYAYEQSVQDLICCISPELRFSRNYSRIRPYEDFCEETIECLKDES
jgi:hypothetical protein